MPALKPDDNRRSAVALTYRDGQKVPNVVAKGYGELADRIVERAREAGVFVHDSPALVSLLMQVDLDSQIPPELYRAVAEVLAFVYFLEQQTLAPDTRFGDWRSARPQPAEG
ncbi:EscU/YscU/HrcU family type III secretion system export apparatus switch protein [Crenobacter cavernae]|uniref:Flagellar biosynthesis protein FlhB n=1 Tax=Crenobacter cavernae TaxID=2290923 RepID=A0A345Y615_9NEIS|nr:EscU/YscU/HrcU family type III secretion system export apparatus switch protein [Crenobacter cavernae]AXK39367.1 flagellar biosynthesis protein FlhB [Crenobacter cavernae]RXZ44825.1 flagellar biosynthesis protein FlhB [Crenobacter cavernae]